jgi:hypothetical protein
MVTDLGLRALRVPLPQTQALSDVIESIRNLTPDLVQHLRSHKDDLRKIRWDVLEHLVGECLAQQGFRDVRLVGRDPRNSADIYATWIIDSTGMVFRLFVEVKRWKERVGITVINEVLGAIFAERQRFGWHAGMIVSIGGFSDSERMAASYLSLKGVELKAREYLLRWLENYRPNKNGLWLPAPEKVLPSKLIHRTKQ